MELIGFALLVFVLWKIASSLFDAHEKEETNTIKTFAYPIGDDLPIDSLMEKSGYERIRLRGAEIDEYAPIGTLMVHIDVKNFLKEPIKTPWGEGTVFSGLRRVYRRTEEVEAGHIVFTYDPSEDR